KGKRQNFRPARGGWWLSYNERTIEIQGEDGPETWYEYDQVWIREMTIEAIVEAIIRTKYSINDEFKMSRISKSSTEWKDYNAFADAAVAKAHEVLNV
ncbi:MAG: hypothetical protein WC473_06065, partial [Patescibacteria group bacterium]